MGADGGGKRGRGAGEGQPIVIDAKEGNSGLPASILEAAHTTRDIYRPPLHGCLCCPLPSILGKYVFQGIAGRHCIDNEECPWVSRIPGSAGSHDIFIRYSRRVQYKPWSNSWISATHTRQYAIHRSQVEDRTWNTKI